MSASTAADLRRVRVGTTLVATLTASIVIGLGAVLLVESFERQQIDQVDRRLVATAAVIGEVPDEAASIPTSTFDEALAQLVDDSGAVDFATPPLEGRAPMRQVGDDPASPVTGTVDGLGDVRAVATPFGDSWLLYGETLDGVERSVSDLTSALLVAVPLLTVLLGGLVWLVVGRTLRPVRRAMERERRLFTDVTHELRTPLAGARALLESESEVPAEIELNRLEALTVLSRLEAMVADLLVEARSGGTDLTSLGELVDLDDIALDAVGRLPRHEGVLVDTSAISGGQVRGNEADLSRMATNLLANGVRHARSTVRISVQEDADAVILAVDDDGAGVPQSDREKIFERFTRLDEARTFDGAGAGLGLPIARSVVVAHGGTILVGEADLGGASFVVTIPAAESRGRRL